MQQKYLFRLSFIFFFCIKCFFCLSKFSFFEMKKRPARIWQVSRSLQNHFFSCRCVYFGMGLGSIFPTITPKCLAQLAVYVIVEVLVYIRGKCTVAPLFKKKKRRFSPFFFFVIQIIYFSRFTFLVMYNKPVVFFFFGLFIFIFFWEVRYLWLSR